MIIDPYYDIVQTVERTKIIQPASLKDSKLEKLKAVSECLCLINNTE